MKDKQFISIIDINEVAKKHSNPKYANWKVEYINDEYIFYLPKYKKD